MNPALKKTLFISLCSHLTFFLLFNFTFGVRLPQANFSNVAFFGSILSKSDLERGFLRGQSIKNIFYTPPQTLPLDKLDREDALVFAAYRKPPVSLTFSQQKSIFLPKTPAVSFKQRQAPAVIMFYPRLPHHFLFYFKDRQSVHIELEFNLVSKGKVSSTLVKRKISSGNLEADLLAMRYIGHYLFVQQMAFPRDIWQTVKIDLSAKEDDQY